MKVLADLAAGGCGLLFLAAVLGKLDSWGQWSQLAREMPGPAVFARGARLAVPTVEGVIVVLCIIQPRAGLAVGAVALASFAVAVQLLLGRLAGRECNCFGAVAPATISQRLVVRDVALALLAGAGWYLARHEDLRALSPSKVLVVALAGVITLMLVQSWRLLRPPLTAIDETTAEEAE